MDSEIPNGEIPDSELRNPGADGKEGVPFERYLPFVHSEGLSIKVQEDFKMRLKKAYELTKESNEPTVWQPASCKRTLEHYDKFKGAFVGLPFRLMYNNPKDHKWYEVDIEDEQGKKTLVIDPSGYPDSQETADSMIKSVEEKRGEPFKDYDFHRANERGAAYEYRYKYRPYFGIKELAPAFPKAVYESPDTKTASEMSIELWWRKRYM